MRRTIAIIALYAGLVLGTVLALTLAGCRAPGNEQAAKLNAPPPLAVAVPQIAEPVKRSTAEIEAGLKAMEQLKGVLSLSKGDGWQEPFVAAMTHFQAAKSANSESLTKVGIATDSVKADAKSDQKRDDELDRLKKNDPVRAWFQRIGAVALAAFAAVIALSFVPMLSYLKGLRELAFGIGLFGAALLALARFLPAIEWAALAGLVIAIGLIVWKHHRQIAAWVKEEQEVAK